MAKKKKDSIEYRYYEIGQDEYVLALFGESWVREYGRDVDGFHFHNLMEIGVCRDGHGEMGFEEHTIPYHPGTITIIPKNVPHVTISQEGKTSFWEYLFLDPAMLVREIYPGDERLHMQLLEQMNNHYRILSAEGAMQCAQMIDLIIYEMSHKEKHYRQVTKGLCEALLLEMYRFYAQEKSDPASVDTRMVSVHLKNVFEYIDKSYMLPELRIEDLADHCGLSETHFRRVFKEQTRMSPAEYVNLVRIQHACELMRRTDMNMEEVSASVGFESTTSFTRNFKKFLDITPYQWKKNPENHAGQILEYNVSVLKGW